jgi:apolipoprotein N-acyltransferase
MKISKYLACFFKDFFTTCGCLMVITSMFLTTYSTETIEASTLFQIILVALSYTFFKFAFANKYELGKKAQMISFAICFMLADMPIILWLFLFSPGKILDINVLITYILVILIVKGAVYAMMYIDGNKQAKQVNEKLSEYKNGGNA